MALAPAVAADAVSIHDVIDVTGDVKRLADSKIDAIRTITSNLRMLALNAMIESARAGESGRGFAIVAQEVKNVSAEVEKVAGSLESELSGRIGSLEQMTRSMSVHANTERLVDLALNAIEVIDRNLYERSCNVRWWARDGAVVAAASAGASSEGAAERFAAILGAYTIYLDIWLCSLDGTILAGGRPGRFRVAGENVSGEAWFERARRLANADEFASSDVASSSRLGNAPVATFATAVREGGKPSGRPIGVLAVHFDWGPQAKTVLEGVRFSAADKARSRALITDQNGLILAASDGRGVLTEIVPIKRGEKSGCFEASSGQTIAFHRTPGYETYRGQGWYGVIVQDAL
ncbi:MAG: methyl-accepting chemotaxis protein [Hyphomicrobium sp.]